MHRKVLLTLIFATMLSAAPAIAGSANLFDGTALETTVTPRDVNLQNGVAVRFATRSAGTVYNDHLILQQGAVRIANFDNYAVDAQQLRIEADDPGTQAVVRMTGKTIEVASIGGSLKVTDGGAMLTRVAAGTKVSFQQTSAKPAQTGAAPAPKGPITDSKGFWVAVIVCAVGAAVLGGVAAAQGKNPF